ncbi:MAG: gamma-glutamyltransferase, partial [Planctomycetota bacterium]
MARSTIGSLACVLTFALAPTLAGQPQVPASAGRFAHAAVAADHAIASQAGLEILNKGGNAVDAAVATSFVLSVVRPFSCGIGGGGFMVIHLSSHPNTALKLPLDVSLNYREQAPAWATPDCYERLDAAGGSPDSSTKGGTAVAIPGTMLGLLTALERYGTLDRATVLAPAIRAAEEGFIVDAAYLTAVVDDVMPWYAKEPARRERFAWVWHRFLRDGSVKVGDVITLPEQAQALRLLARDGVVAFTQGPIGLAIVAAVRGDIANNPVVAGGGMTMADLNAQTVVEQPPLSAGFRGDLVLTMPPPSSGGIVLAQVFATLDARVADLSGIAHNSPDYIHFVAEASKHAFADRARWLADTAFSPVPLAALLNPAMLAARGKSIDFGRVQAPASYGLSQIPEDHGTSHLSVVDAMGNAVACTETINLVFGSLLAVPEFGFVLNNEMDDFLTRRGKPNAFGLTQSDRNLPAPGKRPLSSMSPT